tara:strand:+ start:113 stop:730 length:618 start_codon:yes stop_codon:yes gene_type:complete
MIPKIDFTLDDVLLEEDIVSISSTYRDISCTSKKELNKNLKISNPLFFNYGYSSFKRLNKEKLNLHLLEDCLVKNYDGIWRNSTGGCLIYEKGDYMGWHTNNEREGIRFYFTYSFEEKSNFFRYRNPYTEEVVDSYDKVGWNFRLFYIDKENPFWHCVVANSKRYSFGFSWDKENEPSQKIIEEIKLCLQSQSHKEALQKIGLGP